MTRGITPSRLRGAWHRIRAPYVFISFPKSGRTWTRHLLESYLKLAFHLDDLDFESETLWRRAGNRRRFPRMVFVHPHCEDPDPGPTRAYMRSMRRKKVVLMVRDPRKVVYTYYFRLSRRFRDPRIQAMDIGEFIRHPRFGIRRIVAFSNIWFRAREGFRDCLVLRFEDMTADPEAGMNRLLAFLDVEMNPDLLRHAIAATPDRTTTALEDESVTLSTEDQKYLDREARKLDPGLGYKA